MDADEKRSSAFFVAKESKLLNNLKDDNILQKRNNPSFCIQTEERALWQKRPC